jgi:hypothetical protein
LSFSLLRLDHHHHIAQVDWTKDPAALADLEAGMARRKSRVLSGNNPMGVQQPAGQEGENSNTGGQQQQQLFQQMFQQAQDQSQDQQATAGDEAPSALASREPKIVV